MMKTNEKSQFSQLLGLTEDQARALAKELGIVMRVIVEDGDHYCHSCDYREDRINVAMYSGLICEIISIG